MLEYFTTVDSSKHRDRQLQQKLVCFPAQPGEVRGAGFWAMDPHLCGASPPWPSLCPLWLLPADFSLKTPFVLGSFSKIAV